MINGKILEFKNDVFLYLDNIELTRHFEIVSQAFSDKASSRFSLYSDFFSENLIYAEKSSPMNINFFNRFLISF